MASIGRPKLFLGFSLVVFITALIFLSTSLVLRFQRDSYLGPLPQGTDLWLLPTNNNISGLTVSYSNSGKLKRIEDTPSGFAFFLESTSIDTEIRSSYQVNINKVDFDSDITKLYWFDKGIMIQEEPSLEKFIGSIRVLPMERLQNSSMDIKIIKDYQTEESHIESIIIFTE